MKKSLIAVAVCAAFQVQASSELSVATAASGNASGACAVTGDGRRRVVIRCTGQPEFEAQVQEAIATLLPSSAINLDEEVSTPGYDGSTRRISDLTLSNILFTPKPSAALAKAGQLEKQVLALSNKAKQAEDLQRQVEDLRSQLDAARSLRLDAEESAAAVPSSSRAPAPPHYPAIQVSQDDLVAKLSAQVEALNSQVRMLQQNELSQSAAVSPAPSAEDDRINALMATIQAQGAELTAHAAELLAMKARPIERDPAQRYVGTSTSRHSNDSLGPGHASNAIARPHQPPQPIRYYARLSLKDAQLDGAHYVKSGDGQMVLVLGPFDVLPTIAPSLAQRGIYPIGFMLSTELLSGPG